MLENFVHFLISNAQRTPVSRAVRADTRGAAPFRMQQVMFDTATGICAERGLYLLTDSVPDLHGDRVHRAIAPVTACAGIEHAWPDGQRQFDQVTLNQLMADPDAALGPSFELGTSLLPRARMISRGRRGLVRSDDDSQSVIEVVFQRCEVTTAHNRQVAYRLSLNLLAGDIKALFSQAWQWQQRFDLILEPQALPVLAARLTAAKPSRPDRFFSPVWLPGRTLPEAVSYPAVSGLALLATTASDLAMQICAIAESSRGDSDALSARMEAFEQDIQAVDCLLQFLSERLRVTLPVELTEPLRRIRHSRYEHLVQSRLTHFTREAGVAPVGADSDVRAALGIDAETALQAVATEAATRQWVLTLLAWCASRDGTNAAINAQPSEQDQETDRQHLEHWVSRAQTSIQMARESESNVRFQLWRELHWLDEAVTQFGAVLPRRLLLRYRMNIRATLVPLTDWLILSRLLRQLGSLDPTDAHVVPRADWSSEYRTLLAAWQQQLTLADQRVISQLARLAQTATPDDPLTMPSR